MKIDSFVVRVGAAGSALALLASCGGGGSGSSGSSGGGGPPVSTAPNITSSSSATVTENVTGVIYTGTATDPQGDAISWDVFSGADAGLFVITSSGALSFQDPPNFDLPEDANQDNVYEVTLRAVAGGEQDTIALRVTVENDPEGIQAIRVGSGFLDPAGMATRADGLKFVVAQKNGKVFELDGEDGAVTELAFIDATRSEGEVLAVFEYFVGVNELHGIFLLTHSPVDGLVLQAFHPTNGNYFSQQIALPWSAPVRASMFASDRPNAPGAFFIAVGDTDGAFAQNGSSGYGKLFEVLPFSAGASLRLEFSFNIEMVGDGVQSPGGGGLFFGQTLIADQGSSTEHEITFFEHNWRPLDFGWPFYEGSIAVRSDAPAQVNGPSLVYNVGTGTGEGTGIIAGVGYAGGISGITGHYVFGDENGTIWSIPTQTLNNGFLNGPNVIERRTEDFVPDVGQIDSPIAFGLPLQTLFILDADGEVFRVDNR